MLSVVGSSSLPSLWGDLSGSSTGTTVVFESWSLFCCASDPQSVMCGCWLGHKEVCPVNSCLIGPLHLCLFLWILESLSDYLSRNILEVGHIVKEGHLLYRQLPRRGPPQLPWRFLFLVRVEVRVFSSSWLAAGLGINAVRCRTTCPHARAPHWSL